jgi:hypothetical protein
LMTGENSMKQGLSWEADSPSANQISQHFIKHESVSQCLQLSVTGPYPEPDECNPHPHTIFS